MHNAEGEQTWERSLDTFGKVIKGDNNSCPFMYQGQYYDSEIDLAYNRFRYYDPEDGRYISVDPIGLFSGEINLYTYVQDINTWVDVFGLSRKSPTSVEDHHIISDKHVTTKNHDLFKKAGHNNPDDFLQSSRNKMDLPTKHNTVDTTSSVHTGRHAGVYSTQIADKMDAILVKGKKENWKESDYRNALGKLTDDIRGKLERGEIALNKNKRKNSSYNF